jgi:hypothetical protein
VVRGRPPLLRFVLSDHVVSLSRDASFHAEAEACIGASLLAVGRASDRGFPSSPRRAAGLGVVQLESRLEQIAASALAVAGDEPFNKPRTDRAWAAV